MPLLVRDERKWLPQTLRDYQMGGISAITAAWAEGEPAPLAALATGAGKTTIIAQLLVEVLDLNTQRALVIGHTAEIIQQIYERVQNQFGGLDGYYHFMEPGIGMVMGENDVPNARIVVATRQSLHVKRLRKVLQYGAFDYVIIDEAHHALGDNTYGAIIDEVKAAHPNVKICGFTATPARTDRQALASIFSRIVYQWLIPEGIHQGYLVPVTRLTVKTQVDASSIKTRTGDYQQDKLISALKAGNWLDLCMDAMNTYVLPSARQTLAFMPSVEMSQEFTGALKEAGVKAAHIDANTPKDQRRSILAAYTNGQIQVVSNMAVLTEGFDAPATGCIFLGRPTRSQTLFTQIVGRGLRLFPGKHDCLLVDMTVEDTRALEVGTLLGKMYTCKPCKAQFFASLRQCPHCGAEKQRTLREAYEEGLFEQPTPENETLGIGLITTYNALFEKAFAAWYQGSDGFLSCTLSFDDGAMIVVPPLEDNFYRLAFVPKENKERVRFLSRNEDLAALLIEADEKVRQKAGEAMSKEAAWRQGPASEAQIGLLRKLGVSVSDGLSKGTASQMITHAIAVKRLIESES